jgi:hypothetical protein
VLGLLLFVNCKQVLLIKVGYHTEQKYIKEIWRAEVVILRYFLCRVEGCGRIELLIVYSARGSLSPGETGKVKSRAGKSGKRLECGRQDISAASEGPARMLA